MLQRNRCFRPTAVIDQDRTFERIDFLDLADQPRPGGFRASRKFTHRLPARGQQRSTVLRADGSPLPWFALPSHPRRNARIARPWHRNPARESKGKSRSTAEIERTSNRPFDDHLALVDHLAIAHQHVLVLRNQVLVPLVVEVADILASLAYFSIRSSTPSAHARLTVKPAFCSPGILSQPPFSMNSALFQELIAFNSLSLAL